MNKIKHKIKHKRKREGKKAYLGRGPMISAHLLFASLMHGPPAPQHCVDRRAHAASPSVRM
jgi:hypothetical protein